MQIDRRLIVAALGFLVFLLLICSIFSLGKFGNPRVSRAAFIQSISKYNELGYLRDPLTSDKTPRYHLSAATLDYSGQKTFGEVRRDLNLINLQLQNDANSVERRLSFKDYITAIAGRITSNTSFQGRVTVNEIPKTNSVNILFLTKDPDHLVSRFSDTLCAYIGKLNTILCNASNVETTLKSFINTKENFTTAIAVTDTDGSINIDPFSSIEIFRQLLEQNFLIWLIGHELGHAVLHNKEVTQDTENLHFNLVFDKREQAADSFTVRSIRADSQLEAAFPVMLLEFIEQEFRKTYQVQYHVEPSIKPAFRNETKTIILTSEQIEMRLLMRAIRIMDESLEQNPKALQQATYATVDGRLAYVGSLKFPEYYQFIKSRIAMN